MKKSTIMVSWKGQDVADDVRKAAADGLSDGAEHILEEANRTVPHDEGTLERSGVTDVDRQALQASVSYNTPYARRQHEGHYRHPNGRRRKWLELTLQERGKAVRDYIAKKIEKALKG